MAGQSLHDFMAMDKMLCGHMALDKTKMSKRTKGVTNNDKL